MKKITVIVSFFFLLFCLFSMVYLVVDYEKAKDIREKEIQASRDQVEEAYYSGAHDYDDDETYEALRNALIEKCKSHYENLEIVEDTDQEKYKGHYNDSTQLAEEEREVIVNGYENVRDVKDTYCFAYRWLNESRVNTQAGWESPDLQETCPIEDDIPHILYISLLSGRGDFMVGIVHTETDGTVKLILLPKRVKRPYWLIGKK